MKKKKILPRYKVVTELYFFFLILLEKKKEKVKTKAVYSFCNSLMKRKNALELFAIVTGQGNRNVIK